MSTDGTAARSPNSSRQPAAGWRAEPPGAICAAEVGSKAVLAQASGKEGSCSDSRPLPKARALQAKQHWDLPLPAQRDFRASVWGPQLI